MAAMTWWFINAIMYNYIDKLTGFVYCEDEQQENED